MKRISLLNILQLFKIPLIILFCLSFALIMGWYVVAIFVGGIFLIWLLVKIARSHGQLRDLAYHDGLTGLYNRIGLENQIEKLILEANRQKNGFAVLYLDLDHFKVINDTIGHDAGDVLLQVVAKRLKNSVRSTDKIARVGGDEFIIVLNKLNKVEKITNIIKKFLLHFQDPIIISGMETCISLSIGVSVFPYDGNDIKTLIKNADLALYRAKELGRNRYQFCTPEMTARAQEKISRQNALIQGLARDEFILYYQPKFDLVNQRISGMEALLRWNNPQYCNIAVPEIIHLAEDTGLIVPLSEWILKTSCRQIKYWQGQGLFPLTLAVNLSGRQFKQTHFVENILEIVKETGLAPSDLELEITEDLIMQDPEYIFNTLHALKKNHVKIAIDNFGIGYSSLDYLRRFSIDKIKIDKSFIQKINIDVASNSIVTAIIAMSNKMGIQTVAEGVETKEQYLFLLREKCTEIQGYYIKSPGDADEMTGFLKEFSVTHMQND